MRNPTLHDVARAAGVSYSTADRVLNQRGGVAEKSILRVQHAIQELGYRRDIHAANLSRRRSYRFRFYLPQGDHGFFSVLRDAAQDQGRARALDRINVDVHDVPALDADALAIELASIAEGDCDCVAIVGADSDRLGAAVARLAGLGIAVVTLVSDVESHARAAYIGINNIAAGRTAGRLIGLAHTARYGRILPILGKLGVRDHRERLRGVSDVLAGVGGISLLPALEVMDRPDRMLEHVGKVLTMDPDITGIYSIGAGNRALIRILGEMGGARPFVVLHELSPHSRVALEGGLVDAVIDQKPAEEIAQALDAMKAIVDGEVPIQAEITPTIYLKDNLPGPTGDGEHA
ncbi:LacI family DNA-binding transcriptional regulator [Paracoccus sp. Z330]|uniref:LacI family DNA-binding transcriptional regulator n=1 Tax=Paracoccus onchidii TaxID=3017813 RepID=A0ABT4ZA95_9RHOB|nr:LacI family DNA-binding transcriptional regulator [Paracoccus onchidii]MDB6176276.1 LacI family DNA-binding transcriptional regulator [Paracoccus onchidii]